MDPEDKEITTLSSVWNYLPNTTASQRTWSSAVPLWEPNTKHCAFIFLALQKSPQICQLLAENFFISDLTGIDGVCDLRVKDDRKLEVLECWTLWLSLWKRELIRLRLFSLLSLETKSTESVCFCGDNGIFGVLWGWNTSLANFSDEKFWTLIGSFIFCSWLEFHCWVERCCL